MDASGYITDYRVEGGTIVSTGDADSTDAYAGVFLLAVEAANTAAPDRPRLEALAPALRVGGECHPLDTARRRPHGSEARVDGLVPHERGGGVRRVARSVPSRGSDAVIGCSPRRRPLPRQRIERGVDRLWNQRTSSFDWAVHPDGTRQATSWDQVYPDALSQVWAVRFGLVRGPRARPS